MTRNPIFITLVGLGACLAWLPRLYYELLVALGWWMLLPFTALYRLGCYAAGITYVPLHQIDNELQAELGELEYEMRCKRLKERV